MQNDWNNQTSSSRSSKYCNHCSGSTSLKPSRNAFICSSTPRLNTHCVIRLHTTWHWVVRIQTQHTALCHQTTHTTQHWLWPISQSAWAGSYNGCVFFEDLTRSGLFQVVFYRFRKESFAFLVVPERPVSIQNILGQKCVKLVQCRRSELHHTASANQMHCSQMT